MYLLNDRIKSAFPSTANCSDSTSHEDDVLLDNSSFEDFFHQIKPVHQKDRSVSANIIENTLTRSEAIQLYTPYDVTNPRPRKMKIAFFANFGGIEKLFCVLDQSLN